MIKLQDIQMEKGQMKRHFYLIYYTDTFVFHVIKEMCRWPL